MLKSWSFDFYVSLSFWVALAIVVLLVRLVRASPRARSWLLLACSTALLLTMTRFDAGDLILVWSLAAVTFGVCRFLSQPEGASDVGRRWVATAGVLAVLAFLVVFKYRFVQDLLWTGKGAVVPEPSDYIVLIGVSYYSFKTIHVIVESFKRSVTHFDALTYFNYLTFFPAFVSGPINRYSPFAADLARDKRGASGEDLKLGSERIVHGLFKKLVLAQLCLPYTIVSRPLDQLLPGEILLGLYAYALFFYFDFSGYSDMAIGAARLIGIELPENFNWPFLQKNIREFWGNCHMSLTSWLVDYIYWPIVRKLRNVEFFRTRPVLLSVVGMNATFIACGLWHGEGLNFLIWGAYHGMGISAVNVYQRQKRRIRNEWVQQYFSSKISRVIGALGTFHFYVFGLVFFVLDMAKVQTLFSILVR